LNVSHGSHLAGLSSARVSRRRFIAAGVAGAAAVGAVAVGCGGRSSGSPTPSPKSGGTLRTATTLPLAYGLDPQVETGTGLAIFPRVYGYLLHVDPSDDSIVYDHAHTLEQPDEKTYIVRMREGVRFQDVPPTNGRAVTADDSVQSLLRFRDNPLVLNKTWHTTVLDAADVVDRLTLRITTKRPYAYSPSEIGAIGAGAIIPKENISGVDLRSAGVGSGPFRVDTVENALVRLARNDDYFRAPIPYLDAMEWSIVADDAARLAAFRQRSADTIPNRDRIEAEELARSTPGVETTIEPALAYVSLGLRVDRSPFNDPRVRDAIDIALDRDDMVRQITFGDGQVLGPVNPHLASGYWSLARDEIVASQRGADPIDARRADARSLLSAASAAGARIRLQVAKMPQLLDVADAVASQLRRIGLTVDLETLDQLAWYVNFRRGDFDATIIGQLPYESPDQPTRMYHSGGIDGAGSMFGFADPAIDALVERSWGEIDREQRRQTLLEAQRLMIAARPMIQLFTSTAYSTAWSYVRNRHPGVTGSMAQYNYEQWLDVPT
jgi:peptide/nickel transport system substrate-binding protein